MERDSLFLPLFVVYLRRTSLIITDYLSPCPRPSTGSTLSPSLYSPFLYALALMTMTRDSSALTPYVWTFRSLVMVKSPRGASSLISYQHKSWKTIQAHGPTPFPWLWGKVLMEDGKGKGGRTFMFEWAYRDPRRRFEYRDVEQNATDGVSSFSHANTYGLASYNIPYRSTAWSGLNRPLRVVYL